MKKELELKQNQEVSKMQALSAKAKKSGYAAGFTTRTNRSMMSSRSKKKNFKK